MIQIIYKTLRAIYGQHFVFSLVKVAIKLSVCTIFAFQIACISNLKYQLRQISEIA